jgi:hypothetical protein
MLSTASDAKKLAAIGAFLIMGMSPSFMDWQQSPEKHRQFLGFYAVAIPLFWYGFLS